MTEAASDWCEIYVKGAEDVSALVALVATAAGGKSDGRSVMSPEGVEIYVVRNSTNPKFEPVPPSDTDFVFWPFVIDMEVDEERGVPLVAAVLRTLWTHGLWAVAACSFEARLPRSGGFSSGRLILEDD